MKDYSQTGILFDFLFWSLLLWQIGFIVGILLKLFYKPSGKKFVQTAIPAVEVMTPRVQPGHIDIEMNKKQMLLEVKSSEFYNKIREIFPEAELIDVEVKDKQND